MIKSKKKSTERYLLQYITITDKTNGEIIGAPLEDIQHLGLKHLVHASVIIITSNNQR